MQEDTTNTYQNTPQRPIYIDPRAGKSRFPKPLLWALGCFGGCISFFILILVFFSVLMALFSAGTATTFNEDVLMDGNVNHKVAVIPLNGVIVDEVNDGGTDLMSLGQSSTSNKTVESMLDVAANDPNVQAIILRENTPGGSTLAMRKICTKLESMSKPVYTYIESEGASAGYYLANCTRYIIADQYAVTGSIGALVEATDLQGLLDKLGIKTKVITNTEGIYKNSDLFSGNSKDEQKIKALLDDIYGDFIKQIVKGRNTYDGTSKISEEKIRSLATGEIYSGKDAKANGLIDDTGMFEDAVKAIKTRETLSSDIMVVQYGYVSGWFNGATSMIKDIAGLKNNVIPVSLSTIYALRKY